MGQAQDRLQAIIGSPENQLGRAIAFLDTFRTHWQLCRASGNPLNPSMMGAEMYEVSRTTGEGSPISGDPDVTARNQHAMQHVQGIVDLVGAHPKEAGPCPADDAFSQHVEIMDEQWVADWLPGGARTKTLWKMLAEASSAATAERQAEDMKATINSLAVGIDVTLTEFPEEPVSFARITGGSVEDGFFSLHDGGVARLQRHGLTHAAWILYRDGERTEFSVRPRQPGDEKQAALRVGLLGDDGEILTAPELPFGTNTHFSRSIEVPGRIVAMPSGTLSDRIVNEMLPGMGYGDLFAYMVRRHGPASMGGDDYKDLCGSWLLTTGRDDLFLTVQPSVSTGMSSLNFGLYTFPENRNRLEALFRGYVRSDMSTAEGQAAAQAYFTEVAPYTRTLRDALGDLQRPVIVRDCSINALGALCDDSPLHGHGGDDEEDDLLTEGPLEDRYSLGATTGLPPGFLDDKNAVYALVKALRTLDATDWSSAMHQAAEMLKAPAPVADAPEPTTAPSPR